MANQEEGTDLPILTNSRSWFWGRIVHTLRSMQDAQERWPDELLMYHAALHLEDMRLITAQMDMDWDWYYNERTLKTWIRMTMQTDPNFPADRELQIQPPLLMLDVLTYHVTHNHCKNECHTCQLYRMRCNMS